MAWSQSDLDAINQALALGAKRVRFQTHETEYQSVADMLRVRDLIKSELEGGEPSVGPILTEYQSDI